MTKAILSAAEGNQEKQLQWIHQYFSESSVSIYNSTNLWYGDSGLLSSSAKES